MARGRDRVGPHAAAQGKGYAAEGASAAIDWTFDVLGWDRIIHCIHKDKTIAALAPILFT